MPHDAASDRPAPDRADGREVLDAAAAARDGAHTGHCSTDGVEWPISGPPHTATVSLAAAGTASPRRVLVADDNADAANSLALVLNLMGHDARTAHDGMEAVALAAAFEPELILLDIGMPRLNGYDACRRIRATPPGRAAVIIALTGWGQERHQAESRAAGFDRHLIKPIDLAALSQLLEGLPAAADEPSAAGSTIAHHE